MRKLGKKNDEILETIEAFDCADIRFCECNDYNTSQRKQYYSINNNEYWRELV